MQQGLCGSRLQDLLCGKDRLEERRTQGQWKRALSGRLPEDTLAVLERLRRSK